jgi:hypothetical protein
MEYVPPAFFEGLEREGMGFQVHAINGRRQGFRQAAAGISQHTTERLHVEGEAPRGIQERRVLLQNQVFPAAVRMKEFSRQYLHLHKSARLPQHGISSNSSAIP